jgi:tripartite-type tricarboxylate transporter receptor subunit TctC
MTPSNRRQALAAGLATLASPWVRAQAAWPGKPVTVVVPFPPGGGTDAFARPLFALMTRNLSRQFVIDNKGGAGGTLGAGLAAKAAPDGYTYFMGAVHHAIAPSMYPKLDYNIETDFVPVGLVSSVPQVIVVNPAKVQATTCRSCWSTCARTRAGSTTHRPAMAPRTTWRANCSSCRPRPSSPTSPTAVPARPCRT